MKASAATLAEWFWDVLFPPTCLGCGETLQYSKREIFCPVCRHAMLISDTHLIHDHPLRKRLNIEFPFQLVFSKYRYPNKSQRLAKLIYGLKYQNLRHIGTIEGEEYGQIIAPLLRKHKITGIIPTPLHWRKEIKRGYNQSLEFASGISRTSDLPVINSVLRRVKSTQSQTTLNKQERVVNMKNAFRARTFPGMGTSPHFLLVDDVVTSGVTLVEMARTLQHVFPTSKCSVCTLAYKDYG